MTYWINLGPFSSSYVPKRTFLGHIHSKKPTIFSLIEENIERSSLKNKTIGPLLMTIRVSFFHVRL